MRTIIPFMQRMLLIVVGLVCAAHVSADNFKAENEDGVTIYYSSYDETNVEVTYNHYSGGDYSGNVKIPSSVTNKNKTYNVTIIGSSAFANCISLESIVLPETITKIEAGAFKDCISLTSIALPSSLTEIRDDAFFGCSYLKSIEFPNGLLTIGREAFKGCSSLTSVSIPSSLRAIGYQAFILCNLETITSYIENPFVLNYAFDNTISASDPNTVTTLFVPAGTTGAYKKTTGWYFTNIVEMDPIEDGASVTMNNNYQTFCFNRALDFSGAGTPTAYIASGFCPSTGDIMMARVAKVPANTGVILKGIAGHNYKVPFTETDYVFSNFLVGAIKDIEISSGYVFDGNEFKAVNEPQTIKEGEAYLNLDTNLGKRLRIRFTDTLTGVDDLKMASDSKAVWHTLQGSRLTYKPTQRGIYLRGGKKVLVK